MNEILEILKYTLPAIIVFITAWLIIKQMIKNDQNRRNYEIVLKNQEMITPVRLQAFERLTLLLERISPEALIMRISNPKMKAKQLHTELLNTIRSEFDHNVSQQVYISHQSWEIIKNTRTNIVKLVNSTAKRINPDAPAYELGKAILEDLMLLEKSPINIALEVLKKRTQATLLKNLCMYRDIEVIGFDADDTLWVNEPYFRDIEAKFCELLKDYLPEHETSKKLLEIEISNLHIYGYGVKGFILSLIETAIRISNKEVKPEIIEATINLGKELLSKEISLLDDVKTTLEALHNKGFKLIVATKGDLLDQERKLTKSGLEKYFHHIEVMSDKKESDYLKLIKHLDVNPNQFVMIGNSLKSDILPILNIGSKAIHIPFHTTWEHEHVSKSDLENKKYDTLESISELLNFF